MAPTAIIPKALKPGDTMAFISPSARLNDRLRPVITRGIEALSQKGYKVREIWTPDAESSIQKSITSRLSEIRTAFSDPDVSAIFCTIGGTTFTELIPALVEDKELHETIRANPKIVIGYSDITGVHWFLLALTGLRTFYGPGIIPELGDYSSLDDETSPRAFCLRNFLRAVTIPEPLGELPRSVQYAHKPPEFFSNPASEKESELAPSTPWVWIRNGKAQGRLLGGCLTVMARLQGVRSIAPDWRGRIVFFETALHDDGVQGNLKPRVQAAIADLIAGGVFDEAAGLVVGRPFGYDTPEERAEYIGLIEGLLCQGRFADKKFPILFNIDIGHSSPLLTLPMDALVELDSENNSFKVLEAAVE